ncbi:MAG: V-type ATP synthase subunit E family protein [Candidatus Omnitrophica bacterium]|jgi:vacuolar-type H+-ATPase subunit E/Vma4|nr:V-type ATP synthase subunit E family protein [Candidatus Omnitrophota bacterium]
MAEDLKRLIEKIQKEGIEAAKEKASKIEAQAHAQAQAIISKAKEEANRLLEQAKAEIIRQKEATTNLLRQSARDTVIGLRQELLQKLSNVIKKETHAALKAKDLSEILIKLMKECSKETGSNVEITLSKEDADKLTQAFISGFKEELKKGITLKTSDEISGGFLISYDAGKSQFDFTDSALAQYLAQYVQGRLDDILQPASTKTKP